mmetsp:Transcript_10574/g.12452  ORF Transcript_10574/g.12452 Transcript_10574/m.12452 type:complete len:94 (+) Transcript_10574:774-1055(+)
MIQIAVPGRVVITYRIWGANAKLVLDGVVHAILMTTVVNNSSVRNLGSNMGVAVCRRMLALRALRPLPSETRGKHQELYISVNFTRLRTCVNK